MIEFHLHDVPDPGCPRCRAAYEHLLAVAAYHPRPKFKIGQPVRVFRKVPKDAYYNDLTGVESTIAEIDAVLGQVNYTLASGHYVHEQELEAV